MIVFDKDKFIKGFIKGKYSFSDASKSLRDDEEVILTCASFCKESKIYPFISKRLKKSEQFKRELVNINGLEFRNFNKEDKDKDEFALIASVKYPQLVTMVSDRLRNSKQFAINLVSLNPFALKHLDDKYYTDDEVASVALEGNALVYKDLCKQHKTYYDFALKGVESNGMVFHFLNENFKNNERIIISALNHQDVLTYFIYKDEITPEFQTNFNVALCACKNNINCINIVPTKLFEQLDFQKELCDFITTKTEEIANSEDENALQLSENFELKAKGLFLNKLDAIEQEKEILRLQELEQSGQINDVSTAQNLVEDN